ncbi:RsmB/NOP family class I SAM-dependent RNA methyltransferase [Aquisalinus flavus]|uniref:tRNA/rRNA methyltransferase n=1 Tax=Aquisalinus flavus TaxID=1526572 RepID=A0A8J2V4Y9_9PROT|nr:RsmB/NOP family class I SAM-dependent RNA methyltransferase [Aquisalinus flavus]MBD0427611.1 RsmB/NOP family class I SAM-dependent RNA methyltransferase [Aquisalinus flavus]UNE47399.1 RsmB/NOP family class I SAM-dependent RNA methyltransferase [Aquisalinus flavus]GGD02365.1 tRNA/rRNA methyltransferase [Aquisalinus flavus]
MRDAGRITAAIELLAEFENRHLPIKDIISNWGRMNRYAGSGDRAWISGLVLDAIRSKQSLGWRMEDDSPRAVILGALRFLWSWPEQRIADAAGEEAHGPGALTGPEAAHLSNPRNIGDAPAHIQADMPEWIYPLIAAVSDDPIAEGQAFTTRAPVDIRVNLLKSDVAKAEKALAATKAEPSMLVANALRVSAPDADAKAPALGPMPAFGKGFVEVQDAGSQLAALAAGKVEGAQVLDLCAGAGGKTLALAAMMANKGQIYAWDADGRRLKPIFDRLRRAGVRNVQVRSPLDGGSLEDLAARMDVVFVDAPCSGSGTWRRKPDTKWRLSQQQMEARTAEQDAALLEGSTYVKPGGRLVYVTCSIFREENEDRLKSFLSAHDRFSVADPVEAMASTGLLADGAREQLETCRNDYGIRLTPARTGTDGFFIAVLQKS